MVWRLPWTVCVNAAIVFFVLPRGRDEGLASESQANVLLILRKSFSGGCKMKPGGSVALAHILISVKARLHQWVLSAYTH